MHFAPQNHHFFPLFVHLPPSFLKAKPEAPLSSGFYFDDVFIGYLSDGETSTTCSEFVLGSTVAVNFTLFPS